MATNKRLLIRWCITLLLVVAIGILKHHSAFIESWFSHQWYPKYSFVLRSLTGWIPFSIGDVLYVVLVVYLLGKLVIGGIKLYTTRSFSWQLFAQNCLSFFYKLAVLYLVFSVIWGLNYNRLGIANQLSLQPKPYNTNELNNLTCELLDEVNETRFQVGDSNYAYPNLQILFTQAIEAYQQTVKVFPFLQYKYPSIKPSLLTGLVSDAGYSGYYNPFTGEAQLNTDLPPFLLPYTICHEMAHQIGYASESEANFVAYLVTTKSANPLFRYSAYFDLYLTANRTLMNYDFDAARINAKSVTPLVKHDIKIYRNYIFGKQINMEPLAKAMYNQYLLANQQKKGIKSYDEVLEWVMAYQKGNNLVQVH